MRKERRGGCGGFYNEGDVREGVGFPRAASIDGWQSSRARLGLLPELEDDLIGGPHLSVLGKEGKEIPLRG
jgi:hypothetical protein